MKGTKEHLCTPKFLQLQTKFQNNFFVKLFYLFFIFICKNFFVIVKI